MCKDQYRHTAGGLKTLMDIEQSLRRYRLDGLLHLIGTRIRKQFDEMKPITEEMIEQRDGILVRRGRLTIAAWQLSDLAYLAILNSHDFAHRIPSEKDLLELMNLFHERDSRVSRTWIESLDDEDKVLAFTIGFSQKQFWYQEPHRLRAEFNRQVQMLEVLSTQTAHDLGLNRICESVTGFDLRTFRKLVFALNAIGNRTTDLTHFTFDGTTEKIDQAITASNVYKVMEFYAADYQLIRDSPLGENTFFSYPIVRTATGRRIVVNQYLLARKIADGPYWILRNHFMFLPNRADQESFVRHFGELFDLYFESLLEYYFTRDSFRRVPERADSRNADWILKYKEWTIVIELKSSLLPLPAKRNYPEPEEIRRFLPTLSTGVEQLDATACTIGDNDRLLKILVHYEPLFVSDGVLRPLAVQMCSSKLASRTRIFFCDLEDIESLFQVMHDTPDLAQTILLEKLDLEHRDDGTAIGKEFHQVIERHEGQAINRFVYNEIDHYSAYIFPDRGRGV